MSDPNDAAATYAALRRETADMLKLGDVEALGLVEGLQLDITSLLRLVIDSLQGRVLAGEEVDLGKLQVAHALLRQMLPTQALVAPASAPSETTRRFGPDHRARLRALIEATVFAPEAAEAERLADAQAREEQTMSDEAAGKPPEERRPLRETLAPAPEVVPFPSKNIATGQQPHLRKPEASAVQPAVSEPAPKGPIPAPKGHSEGWRVGPPGEPWRPYTYWYR